MQSTGIERAWRPRGGKGRVPGLLRKSGADAVKLDLSGAGDVRLRTKSRREVRRTPHRGPCPADGHRRHQVIIGVVQEPVFGPPVVSRLGGVATKVLSDRSAGWSR